MTVRARALEDGSAVGRLLRQRGCGERNEKRGHESGLGYHGSPVERRLSPPRTRLSYAGGNGQRFISVPAHGSGINGDGCRGDGRPRVNPCADARRPADHVPADRRQFGERAESLLTEIQAGSSFEAIARTQSSDPSANQGGLIGPVALSELRPELRDALRDLRVDEVRGVLRLATGFALVQRATERPVMSMRGGEILAVSAVGSVRPTLSVDGFSEANTALNSIDKPEDWNQSPRLICDLRQQSVGNVKSALARRLGPELAKTRTEYSAQDVMEAHVALGQLYSYDGEMTQAIAQFEAARRIAETDLPAAVPDLIQSLGVAHLHKAEMDNGLYHAPGDRCLLSVRGGTPLQKREDFDKAVEYFTKLLGTRAYDVEAKWLLNVGYMATGGYPGLVPQRFILPPADFASPEDVGRFVDVAAQAGVDSFSSGRRRHR